MKPKRLFWDIETSPNIGFFWRPGYKIRLSHDNIIQERAIICICYKWEGHKKVHHLEWDKGCDKSLVEKFMEVASGADELVAHNGDRFDLKWFNGRVLMHGLDPMPTAKTVDTLKIAKKHFALNSNRLDYLGKVLLGHGKIETSYGMWKDIVLNNCPKAMADMVKYCKMDVRLLEQVYEEFSKFDIPKSHAGVMDGNEKWTCPWTGSEDVQYVKLRTTSAGTKQRQMKSPTGGFYNINDKAYRDFRDEQERIREEAEAEKRKEIIEKIQRDNGR